MSKRPGLRTRSLRRIKSKNCFHRDFFNRNLSFFENDAFRSDETPGAGLQEAKVALTTSFRRWKGKSYCEIFFQILSLLAPILLLIVRNII